MTAPEQALLDSAARLLRSNLRAGGPNEQATRRWLGELAAYETGGTAGPAHRHGVGASLSPRAPRGPAAGATLEVA